MGDFFGKKASSPEPPSASETTKDAIQAQVESLPEILAAQQEFGPQFTQAELDLAKEFSPQFLQEQLRLQEEFGPQIAEALRSQREVETPELAAAQDVLTEFLEQENLLTPQEEQKFRADSRAATSVRGLGEGGEAALEEIRGLTALRQQLKSQRLNVALSTAGRTPVGGSLVQQQNVSPGQLVQNVAPSDIFGLQENVFSNLTSQFGVRQKAQTAQTAQNQQFASDTGKFLLTGQ